MSRTQAQKRKHARRRASGLKARGFVRDDKGRIRRNRSGSPLRVLATHRQGPRLPRQPQPWPGRGKMKRRRLLADYT